MRPSALLALLLAAFSPGKAGAAEVGRYGCRSESATRAVCEIELHGTVEKGERLLLSSVNERDSLRFRGREIASTGSFFGRPFHAAILPRAYSLAPLEGELSPTLTLETESGALRAAGIPGSAEVKVIGSAYPLAKLLGPALARLLAFAFLFYLAFRVVLGLRRPSADGWIYPREELRWFLGSLSAYLLLSHEASLLAAPLLWPPHTHLFAQRACLSVALWALTILLLQARFSDRSCIERSRALAPSRTLARLGHAALLLSLGLLAAFPGMSAREANGLLTLPLLPLTAAFGLVLQRMEWQRVLKRSSASPLLFHLSLLLLPLGALAAQAGAVWAGRGDQAPLQMMGWAVLLCSGLRLLSFAHGREKSRELAADCRDILLEHAHGSARLQALCDFVAEEWGAARITVISVEGEDGLVLASGGPEAIPSAQRARPQRLGPFLRRVCKQNQMLYAPVAEELGKDLQSQGLKHSSLAIPLSQERKVRAVFCMMADEGERIPPSDASQLEILIEALTLEILSAVAQNVAEARAQHLMSIARRADALALEHLDHWGHFQQHAGAETRVVVGGDCVPPGPFLEQLRRSPLFGRLWESYRSELRSAWTAVAAAYEFIPKDSRDDFWVISPRAFRNPLLRELGPERVGILLASALERHARTLLSKPEYLAFGYCGTRLVASMVRLRRSAWHGSAVEIDSEDFSFLLGLRSRALPGAALFQGNVAALAEGGSAFALRARAWEQQGDRQIFSILSATADKRELKRIESLALDQLRGVARKAA